MHTIDAAIILCAGEQRRWNGYLGVKKHFVEIDGEPIVYRTARLFRPHCEKVYVVAKETDPEYASIPGAELFHPRLDPRNSGCDKVLSSRELWSSLGRTVILLGDVHFTDRAVRTIVEHERREWNVFGRPFPSRVNGSPHPSGEIFAVGFYPESHVEFLDAVDEVLDKLRRGEILARTPLGIQHIYCQMQGLPINHTRKHRGRAGRYVVIDDFTNDFDYPEDYERFIVRFKGATK